MEPKEELEHLRQRVAELEAEVGLVHQMLDQNGIGHADRDTRVRVGVVLLELAAMKEANGVEGVPVLIRSEDWKRWQENKAALREAWIDVPDGVQVAKGTAEPFMRLCRAANVIVGGDELLKDPEVQRRTRISNAKYNASLLSDQVRYAMACGANDLETLRAQRREAIKVARELAVEVLVDPSLDPGHAVELVGPPMPKAGTCPQCGEDFAYLWATGETGHACFPEDAPAKPLEHDNPPAGLEKCSRPWPHKGPCAHAYEAGK
jgi:hypothetical protein